MTLTLSCSEQLPCVASRPEGADKREFEYDLLLEWLQTGRFGGVPHFGPMPMALVEALRRRNWAVDYRQLANAFPHFAERLDVDEVRSTLSRLGYRTDVVSLSGRRLGQLSSTAMVVLPSGGLHFVTRTEQGRVRLYDPETGQLVRAQRSRTYKCIVDQGGELSWASKPQTSWVVSMGQRFKPELRALLFLTLLSNAMVLLATFSIGFIFDAVLPALAPDTLLALMLGIAALFSFELWLRRFKARLVARVAGRLEYISSCDFFAKLLSLPLEMLTGTPVGDQVGRLKHFESIRDIFCGPVVALAFELPFTLLMLLIIFVVDPVIGGAVLAIIVAHVALGLILYSSLKNQNRELSQARLDYERLLKEAVSARSQIVRRGLGEIWRQRLVLSHRNFSQARSRADAGFRFLANAVGVAMPLAVGIVVVVGATRVVEGSLSGGLLIVCTALLNRLLAPVQQALLVVIRLPEIWSLLGQIDRMLNLPSVADQKERHLTPVVGRLVLEEVVLRYPKSAEPALKGLTVEIDSGAFVCIGGSSGAGKSTLLRVVAGIYRTQAGGAYLDGVNVEQLSSVDRSNRIGYLGHVPLRMHSTIEQYLRLSAPNSSVQELQSVCAELGLDKTVEKLPGGLSFRLDHVAWSRLPPSFGTRLAIAQLLLRKPKLLLLDEPEAGLSPEDEEALLNAIRRRQGQVTCMMVTHRPSTMRRADQVLILQSGKVRYFGAPDRLSI